MHPLVSIYLLCLLFLIITILLTTVKMKRILMQNPEFAFIIQKMSPNPNIKIFILLVIPIIHLIPLLIYGTLCLIPDEKFIEVFKNMVDSEEQKQQKNEIRERIESYIVNSDQKEDKIKNELLIYLKSLEIDINDLQDEKAINKYFELVEKFIMEPDEIEAMEEIIKELYEELMEVEKEVSVSINLLKTKTDKDFLLELKNVIKDIYI